jgi:prepilin-type N-terminal cleavage/methylation domain-containing protein
MRRPLFLAGPRRPRKSGDARHGFTLVEVLTVAVVLSTLVRMSIPGFHEVLLKARAAEVAGDVEVVRVAVASYHADRLEWPTDGYTGQIPAGLEAYLPEGFSFVRAGYRLDFENWLLPSGIPTNPGLRGLVGVSVVTEDRALAQAVLDVLGGAFAGYALGDAYTFTIEGR